MPYKEKILGCLCGAALGDAMGAPTESRSTRQIEEDFGGRVTTLRTPIEGAPAWRRKKGQVTDAFSIPYILLKMMLATGGYFDRELGKKALLEWGLSEWYEPFAGMTTRKVVKQLINDESIGTWEYAGHLGNKLFKSHYYALSSNGSAIKAWPVALFCPEDWETAVRTAVEMSMASHDDRNSLAGAGATAAALSTAFKPDCTVQNMVKSALQGEKLALELADQLDDVWSYPGPSVRIRIEMAIEIAVRYGKNSMPLIRDLVGSGPAVAETLPAVLGLLIAHDGDPMPMIIDAANIGDETAAVASLCGALAGTLRGSAAIDSKMVATVEQENGFDLGELTGRISQTSKKRISFACQE